MEYTCLHTGHPSHGPNYLDTILRVTYSRQLSRKSRLVDKRFCESRTGHQLRATVHLPCLRGSDSGTVDSYNQSVSRAANRRHKDRVLSDHERLDYGEHIATLLWSPIDQSQVLIIPFFARTTMRIQAMATSHVAEVALNVLGIVHLALHFFLRSNADLTAIRRMETIWTRNQGLRLFGPSDLEMTMHITSPVLLDKGDARRFDDDNYKLRKDFHRPSRMPRSSSQPVVPEGSEITHLMDFTVETKADLFKPVQSPPQVFLSPCTPRKAYNYSIFPTFGSAMLRNSMSTTFSQGSEEALEPPKPILPVSHKREFSEQTSATLHIGCRLSNLDDEQHLSQSPSSFRLPLYGVDRSGYDSPLVSPLSSGAKIPGRLPQDTVLLPNQNKRGSQGKAARHSRSENGVPDWHGRRRSRSRSEYRRMTMKALPPDPPVEKNAQPPAYDSPRQF